MNSLNSSVLRGLAAILFGVVLIVWPEQSSQYLVIVIGLFFIIPGLFSLLNYLMSKKEVRAALSFPIEACGSVVLGILLLVFPVFFISILMYLLGILAIIGGVSLIIHLLVKRKRLPLSLWYYVLPVLIVAAGVMILTNPEKVVEKTFIIFGVVCILFGLSLLINWMRFRKISRD